MHSSASRRAAATATASWCSPRVWGTLAAAVLLLALGALIGSDVFLASVRGPGPLQQAVVHSEPENGRPEEAGLPPASAGSDNGGDAQARASELQNRRVAAALTVLRRALGKLPTSSAAPIADDSPYTDMLSLLTGDTSGGRTLLDAPPRDPTGSWSLRTAGSDHFYPHETTSYDALIERTFSQYAALHARIMNTDGQPGSPPARFVSWGLDHHPGAGWGNRMIGFVTAIAVAMLSNRAIVFEQGRDGLLSGSIEPVPLEDGGIDWSWERAHAAHSRASPGAPWTTRLMDVGIFMPTDASCDDWVADSKDVTTIEVDSMAYFLPMLTHNAHYRNWFLEHLGPPLVFFRHAMQRFVRLREHLRRAYDAFVRTKLQPQWYMHTAAATGDAEAVAALAAAGRKRRYVIGLQVRTGHLIRDSHEEGVFHSCARAMAAQAATQPALMNQLAAVRSVSGPAGTQHPQQEHTAEQHSLAPVTQRRSVDVLKRALDAMEALLLPSSRRRQLFVNSTREPAHTAEAASTAKKFSAADALYGGAGGARAALKSSMEAIGRARALGDATEAGDAEIEVIYFLATDSGDVRRRARDALGADKVMLVEGMSGTDAAVLDNLMLAACDDVIITWPKSTFGVIGGALTVAGRPPVTVMSGSKRSHECVRQMTTEPCFHGWYYRYRLHCYTRRFETYEMLNQDNCYFCLDELECPASDQADGYINPRSPLEYEAILEVRDDHWQRYILPEGVTIAAVKSQYRDKYDTWKREHPNLDA